MRWWLLIPALAALPLLLFWVVRDRYVLGQALDRAERIAVAHDEARQTRPSFGGRGSERERPAWDSYRAALGMVVTTQAEAEEVAELLRRGAASTLPALSIDLREGYDADLPDVLRCREIANALLRHASSRITAGQVDRGLRLQLDVAVFGRDLAASGTLIGWVVGSMIADEAVTAIAGQTLAELSPRSSAKLAVRLEQLEQVMPSLATVLEYEMAAAAFSLDGLWKDADAPVQLRLLSGLLAGTTLRTHQTYVAELIEADAMPWTSAQRKARAAEERMRRSRNPLLRMIAPGNVARMMHFARQALARIRAVREILHFRAYGRRLDLDDPFAPGSLQFVADGDSGLRCWSRSPEGDDAVSVRFEER